MQYIEIITYSIVPASGKYFIPELSSIILVSNSILVSVLIFISMLVSVPVLIAILLSLPILIEII